jgi:hypothetical protein
MLSSNVSERHRVAGAAVSMEIAAVERAAPLA